jgi:thioredoxin reductase (NADPH)
MNENEREFDVIIVGGGAAGLSAALWCDELKLSSLILERETEFGGQLLRVYNPIENHLGGAARNGLEMRDIFVGQTRNRGFMRRLQTKVSEINCENKQIVLESGEIFSAKALIVATGVRRRKLGVEGEDFFRGKGVIESGKRDAEKISGERVLIVGGGDAALENALILAERAERVYLAHRRREFRGREEFLQKIRLNPMIEILTETVLKKIKGENQVEAVELFDLKTEKTIVLPVEAVLIRAGVEPNTEIVRGKLALDDSSYIKIDSNCETSAKGVFAVGDVANPLSPTISSAVGMGATAAKTIFSLLNPQIPL